MWFSILLSFFSSVNDLSNYPKTESGFEVGYKFSELAPETQDLVRHVKPKIVDNRRYFSDIEAPNTDNCFTFGPDCQPDWQHYVYKIPNQNHEGEFFVVTFSYNYRILAIKDTYMHQG